MRVGCAARSAARAGAQSGDAELLSEHNALGPELIQVRGADQTVPEQAHVALSKVVGEYGHDVRLATLHGPWL